MPAKHQWFQSFFFLIAGLVALILLPAAAFKWIDPPAHDPSLYRVIGIFEALLALSLLIWYKEWRVWVVLALIASIWMGFSFYVALFGLPCSCMGGTLQLPRGVPLGLNGGMLLGALGALRVHPTHPIRAQRLLWFVALFFIVGFIISSVYFNLI
jgi:hypothetical protein